MDFSISWPSSFNLAHALNLLNQSRAQTIFIFRRYVRPAIIPEDTTPSENTSSLWNRVSTDMKNNPVLWTAIAYQIAVVVYSLIFGAAILAIFKTCVLATFFYTRYLAQENRKLQADNERKNTAIDIMNADKISREQTLEASKTINENLSARLDESKTINENLSARLDESKTINENLKSQKEALEHQIGRLSLVTDELIKDLSTQNTLALGESQNMESRITNLDVLVKNFKQEHTKLWEAYVKNIQDYEVRTQVAAVRFEEQNKQLQETTKQLDSVRDLLAKTTEQLAETLGEATTQIGEAADQLDESVDQVLSMHHPDNFEVLVRKIALALISPNRINRSSTPPNNG